MKNRAIIALLAFLPFIASAAHTTVPVTEINRIKPVPGQTTVLLDGGIEMSDGKKISGNPDGTSAGLNVGSHATDPTVLINGDIWYNSTGNALKARISGATVSLGSGGGGGSVTSVSQTFTGGLITVGGSPVTGAGTLALTVAGTSGGIPYFSSGSTWATSGALTSNALVLGGGAGAAPKVTAGIASNGIAQLQLGVNATTLGSLKFFGSTSGDVTVAPNAVAGTAVALTLPANSGTLLCSGSVVTPAQGGTGLTSIGTALQTLRVNAAGTALEYAVNSAAASALTGNTLAAAVVNSSLTSLGTLTDLAVTSANTVTVMGDYLNLTTANAANMSVGTSFNMGAATSFNVTAPLFTFAGSTSGIFVAMDDIGAIMSVDAANGMTLNGSQLLTVDGDGSALTGIVLPLDTGTTGTLAAARGGTGLASYTVGDLIFASGATTLAKLADVAAGNALISGGVGVAPSWGKIDLATHVTGTLPVTSGGTGRATGTTAYSLIATGTTATGANQTLANGATTELLVGGGAAALPVWTTATGSGAPVRTISPTIATPIITSIVPGANFTLSQNSVAPFTSVNAGAAANSLVLNAGNVGFGTNAPTSSAEFWKSATSGPRLRLTNGSASRNVGVQLCYGATPSVGWQFGTDAAGSGGTDFFIASGDGGTFSPRITLTPTTSTMAGGMIYEVQSLSGAGAVDIVTGITKLTSTGAAQALTLANGTNGQRKTIIHAVDGGSAILTPTTKTGFSTVTFTNVAESTTLVYFTTQGWMIESNYLATVAP